MRQLSLMEEAFVKILSLQGLLATSTKSSPNNDSSSSAFQFQSVMEGLAYDGTDQAIGHGSDIEDGDSAFFNKVMQRGLQRSFHRQDADCLAGSGLPWRGRPWQG